MGSVKVSLGGGDGRGIYHLGRAWGLRSRAAMRVTLKRRRYTAILYSTAAVKRSQVNRDMVKVIRFEYTV
jgi:hypothetical protein